MEIFTHSSQYITKLITEFQNNNIDKITFNKNLLINAIFSYNCLQKKKKNYEQLKEEQNKIFQSFYIREQKQEENEKEILSKVRDRKSKKIVTDAIKEQREILLKELASKKNIKLIQEHTYDTFIPPKSISLSLNLELIKNKKTQKSQKQNNIFNTNLEIIYINPNLNDKNKKIKYNYIEPPYISDLDFDNINLNDEILNEKKMLTNNNENENDMFIKMLNEEKDEILFYDEKLSCNEKKSSMRDWEKALKKADIKNDFEEFKQKKHRNQINDIFSILKENDIIEKEKSTYLNSNSTLLYNELSLKNHFHEFMGYLSEKNYKIYMKKMNYSYLILMLLSYFDFEQFNNSFEYLEDSKVIATFIKKILLFCGISSNKIYESLLHVASNIKDDINFENYLNIFTSILNLSSKFQFYKYSFLLFLVKKKDHNTITLNNYRIFCELIKGKLIYEEEICDNIIGKMIPILKAKYPKDDLDNLNYQHVSIILEFLINYEYGNIL